MVMMITPRDPKPVGKSLPKLELPKKPGLPIEPPIIGMPTDVYKKAIEKGAKKLEKPVAEAKEQAGGIFGFLKKALPFMFPAVGVGLLAKKGAENLVKNTAEEGPKGLLKQVGLSIVAPPLAAFNFIKKLF